MLSGGMGMLGRRGRKERKRLMALLLAGAVGNGNQPHLCTGRGNGTCGRTGK